MMMNWLLPIMAAAGLWFGQACAPATPEAAVESPTMITEEGRKICLSDEERKLAAAINNYRKRRGLKPVPVSASLSDVSQRHVKEMQNKLKKLTHAWVGCPYNGNRPKTYRCMWEKPRELTGYPGYGYECAFVQYGAKPTAEGILKGWRESSAHNDVIANRKIWKDMDWNAMGVGIYGSYAVVWFGEEVDPKGRPGNCP